MAILGVDVGGTFTDAVLSRGRRVTTAQGADRGAAGGVGARRPRARGRREDVDRFAHGTTVATNALLERKGARTAFVTNAGFEHLLHLRRQTRAHLYRLCAAHPGAARPARALPRRARAHSGRTASSRPLDLATLPARRRRGGRDLPAVHAYRDPGHEHAVAASCDAGCPHARVVASHDVAPEFREYERASTTAATRTSARSCALPRALTGAARRRRAARAARHALVRRRRDLGRGGRAPGDDPALRAGRGRRRRRSRGRGAPGSRTRSRSTWAARPPMSRLIAAGAAGRSTERDVGGVPDPPPDRRRPHGRRRRRLDRPARRRRRAACRPAERRRAIPARRATAAAAREPTVTDANLLLGRLPSTLAAGVELDADAAAEALGGIDPADGRRRRQRRDGARAARRHRSSAATTRASFALVAFGGAGPLHACELADELGMPAVLVPRSRRRPVGARPCRRRRRRERCGRTSRPARRGGRAAARRAKPTCATAASRSS